MRRDRQQGTLQVARDTQLILMAVGMCRRMTLLTIATRPRVTAVQHALSGLPASDITAAQQAHCRNNGETILFVYFLGMKRSRQDHKDNLTAL